MDLSLTTHSRGQGAVVAVDGEVDMSTAPKLGAELDRLIHAGHYHLAIDLENVVYMDSSGLGVLVGAHKKVLPHQGTIRVVCTHERVLKIFQITGLHEVFPIHARLDEALVHLPALGDDSPTS